MSASVARTIGCYQDSFTSHKIETERKRVAHEGFNLRCMAGGSILSPEMESRLLCLVLSLIGWKRIPVSSLVRWWILFQRARLVDAFTVPSFHILSLPWFSWQMTQSVTYGLAITNTIVSSRKSSIGKSSPKIKKKKENELFPDSSCRSQDYEEVLW